LTNDGRGDYADSINLFEDTANYNGFIEFLYNHNNDLVDYLFNYYGLSSSLYKDDYTLSIMTPSDFIWFAENVTSGGSLYLDFNEVDISNSLFNSDTFKYHNYGEVHKYYNVGRDFNDVDYVVMYSYGASAYINANSLSLSVVPKILFLFNSSGVPVGYITFGDNSNSNNYKIGYSATVSLNFNFDFENDVKDITSWFAYLYKVDSDVIISSVYDMVYAYTFHNAKDVYHVEDNSGYSGISGWFKDLFYKKVDMSKWNINFIYDDVFYKSGYDFKSLYYYWHKDNSAVIPDTYSYIDVSLNEKGYYFTPKSGCSNDDYKFYYVTNTAVSVYALYFDYYLLSDNILNLSKEFGVNSLSSYKIYSYQPLIDLNIDVQDYLNYTINIYQYSLRHPYYLYYNTACYSVVSANNSDVILEFDKGDFTLSSSEINSNFQNNNINGSNFIGGTKVPSQGTSNDSLADSGVVNPNVGNIDVDDVIKNIPNYVSGFVISIQALVGVAYTFLFGLPAEIFGFLFSMFIIGLVIIVIKLVRGG